MRTILVIDDEPDILDLFVAFFEDEYTKVITAENGKTAESLVDAHRPDVIITDMIMPEKEGIEIVQQIKLKHPLIRIVTMSGMSNALYLETSKMLGAELAITKPINFASLKTKLNELLT